MKCRANLKWTFIERISGVTVSTLGSDLNGPIDPTGSLTLFLFLQAGQWTQSAVSEHFRSWNWEAGFVIGLVHWTNGQVSLRTNRSSSALLSNHQRLWTYDDDDDDFSSVTVVCQSIPPSVRFICAHLSSFCFMTLHTMCETYHRVFNRVGHLTEARYAVDTNKQDMWYLKTLKRMKCGELLRWTVSLQQRRASGLQWLGRLRQRVVLGWRRSGALVPVEGPWFWVVDLCLLLLGHTGGLFR